MITYPLQLPTINNFVRLRLIGRDVIGVTESPTALVQDFQQHPGQKWIAEIALDRIISRAIADEWIAFKLKLKGRFGTFLMGDPSAKLPRGVGSAESPQVKGANQVGDQLITKNWTPSTNNLLLANDWIQLGSGANSRLHKNLNILNSDVNGEATIDLWPSLRESPADLSPIILTNTQGVWRMNSNDSVWTVENPTKYSVQFSCEEDLPT